MMFFHILAGAVAIVAGYIALFAGKGTAVHRKTGMWFVMAMIVLGVSATIITIVRERGTPGYLPVYLVVTGLTTVRPLGRHQRVLDVAFLLLAAFLSIAVAAEGVDTVVNFGGVREGVPAGMMFFLATITGLAAIGDIRALLSGPARGARRIARHLWRMTFGLFVATGSFFLGQADEIPEAVRIWPVLWVLALAPLVVLLYWMYRVRLRKSLRGLQVLRGGGPVAAAHAR
jgi:hypothetical protein